MLLHTNFFAVYSNIQKLTPKIESMMFFKELTFKRKYLSTPICNIFKAIVKHKPFTSLSLYSADDRRGYLVTPPLIGWAHTRIDSYIRGNKHTIRALLCIVFIRYLAV